MMEVGLSIHSQGLNVDRTRLCLVFDQALSVHSCCGTITTRVRHAAQGQLALVTPSWYTARPALNPRQSN